MQTETETDDEDDGFRAVLLGEPVRERIVEFLGGEGLDPTTGTCVYLCRADSDNPAQAERFSLGALSQLLEEGNGIARSLYDVRSVLVHLDVEYVNHDFPAAAFVDPWRAFRLQEPVVEAIEELLVGWGIRPLHVLTGQGHHFVWSFRRNSETARRLSRQVPAVESEGSGEAGFANLGLVMEYLAQRIKELAHPRASVPVEITSVQVPPGENGQRELISIDISEYGDPLESRMIRAPFTRYVKPWRSGLADRLGVGGVIGPCVTIPLHEMDAIQALKCRQEPGDVASLARRCCARIPDDSAGMTHLVEEYLGSPVSDFHRRFYETRHDPPSEWPNTYARTPLQELPGCVRQVLTQPNDLLLKPSGMRLVTRCLLATGWHPRHIAGLIRSKFEDPSHDWKDVWDGYSPAFRADFYVRLFAGQIATGLDRMVDFACREQQSEGFCWPGDPPCDLAPFRMRLKND